MSRFVCAAASCIACFVATSSLAVDVGFLVDSLPSARIGSESISRNSVRRTSKSVVESESTDLEDRHTSDTVSVSRFGTRSESQAAWKFVQQACQATMIAAVGDGAFVNQDGESVDLASYDVIWRHQGDSTDQADAVHKPASIKALSRFVNDGGALYLSGAAFAMLHSLELEPVRPRLGNPGDDRTRAAINPVQVEHPVFRGLQFDGALIPLSDRGFPAISDFHGSGGPTRGMLLARTPGGSENPLVEYQLGKGRIIAMGWRLPHYANEQNSYRRNLEQLTSNILTYLSDSKLWQPVVIRTDLRKNPRPGERSVPPVGLTQSMLDALERAVRDLTATYAGRYANGQAYLSRIEQLRVERNSLGDSFPADQMAELEQSFAQLKREALLDNPLIDFEQILLVKRSEDSPNLGLVRNWQSNSSLPTKGYDNEIAVLSDIAEGGTLSTQYRPEGGRFVGDVDLHWDADRMLFSMPGKNERWQVYEANISDDEVRELPLIPDDDVDNYDACYLPDGAVLFTSTACFTGVPCVKGSSHVSNIYRWDPDTGKIRRLTFEQDHDWCPTVMEDGRVLYLRWEYSDLPHFVSRILFHMNPDGTEQMAYYGSNSYWPNSTFYARSCPNQPNRFVGVVSGHHDVSRMGELILFDAAQGRREADGVVQRIPGYGKKVEPKILDGLVKSSWPKFLHPWPLSDKYFLVAAKPTAQSLWGIYLVDVFDNMLLLKEETSYALLEPIPLVRRATPPVVPSKLDPQAEPDAVVHIADIYTGDGLAGVPRGTVKQLRLLSYQFAYHGMGGQVNRVGLDGPWDVKRILGTVPVESDGSASFRIPANTPISLQPLDGKGKAVQLMRSWMVAMPGEVVSCTGCHEDSNSAAFTGPAIALGKPPAEVAPWYGPPRGFSFRREVQPVLDRHCVACHNDAASPDTPDFADRPEVPISNLKTAYRDGSKFSPSYLALRQFVRGHTIESDIRGLNASEFHADTTRLIQLLQSGHYNVQLDDEAWDRLITWIDLNTPYHGTWHEIVGEAAVTHQRDRRRDMDRRYASLDEDPEAVYPVSYNTKITAPDEPLQANPDPAPPQIEGWPFSPDEATRMQQALGREPRTVQLNDDLELKLILIPAGRFVSGAERKKEVVTIDRPFWMGQYEVTNRQFSCFDPQHDSRIEHGDFLQFSATERGYPSNLPNQPVCRVNWSQAEHFCRWLSAKSGMRFSLPTEAQWEWACRAGANSAMWYGDSTDDFATKANLADYRLRHVDTHGFGLPSGAVPPWRPAAEAVDDGHHVAAPIGSYQANAWGLYDMHGNVWEWTSDIARNRSDHHRIVRGGSWYTRPAEAAADRRLAYPEWFRVYDVGFRVICED